MNLVSILFLLALICAAPVGLANWIPEAQTSLSAAQEKIRQGDGRAALELLSPLAHSGDPEAAYWLGRLYYYDIPGAPRSWPKAFHWFYLAARKGHADAQYKLGGMYFTGRGVRKNLCKAIHWWRLAALQRQAEALNNLGALLSTGQGLQGDAELGLALQILAAELGSEAASENVRNKLAANVEYFAAAEQRARHFADRPDALGEALAKLKIQQAATCRR